MLSWLLNKPRVTAMTRVIHEMCCFAHTAHNEFGTPLHQFFKNHPLLKNYLEPNSTNVDQVHRFWLSGDQQDFSVIVSESSEKESSWIAVRPDGDFSQASIQSTSLGEYIVSIDAYSVKPKGGLANKLVDEFVKQFGALDARF